LDKILNKIPFSLLTIALIFGILLTDYLSNISGLIVAFFLLFLIFAYVLLIVLPLGKRKGANLFSLFLLLVIIFVACVNTAFFCAKNALVLTPLSNKIVFVGFVEEENVKENNNVNYIVKVTYCNEFKDLESKKIIVYSKADSLNSISLGDQIILSGKVSMFDNPLNPDQFNYREYLARKGIYYSLYTQNSCIVKIGRQIISITVIGEKIRKSIINCFASFNVAKSSVGLFASFALGDKSLLDDDVRQSFTNAGVMHVLAISGLHVGIVFLLVDYLFYIFPTFRRSIYAAIIISSVLWCYAILTGLSPSVQRAAFMFTILCFGRTFSRNSNVYNSLFYSAFCLLVYSPDLLFDLGFQLSYLAVFSIVYFQPKISNIWRPKNWIVKWFWDLTTVGFAATIGTAPLSVFYFNQMPNYFIISNILIIPLAIISLYSALIFIVFSKVSFVAFYLAIVLDRLLIWFNNVTSWVANLPNAVSKDLFLSKLEVLALYFVIISVAFFLAKRTYSRLVFLFLVVMFMFGVGIFDIYLKKENPQIIVYSTYPHSSVGFKYSNCHYLIHSIPDSIFNKKYNYNIKSFVNKNRLTTYFTDSLCKLQEYNFIRTSKYYITFCDKRIIILDKKFNKITTWMSSIKTDYLILTAEYKCDIRQTIKAINAKYLILDSSISVYQSEKIINDLEGVDVDIHVVQKDGAFVSRI